MASPAKKRKKNDSTASPLTNRGIDFFFGKKASQDVAQKQDTSTSESFAQSSQTLPEESLSDEQLARKLQAEWNEENGSAAPAPSSPATADENDKAEESSKYARPTEQSLNSATISHNSANDHFNSGGKDLNNSAILITKESLVPDNSAKTLSLQSNAALEDTISATIPFDENPLAFDPQKYLPDLKRHWAAEGGRASYAILTRCFVLVNSTQSRIKIVDTLVNLVRLIIEGDPDSLLPAVWLATNSISPSYISLELGLGGSTISKALKKVCGLDSQGLRNLYNKYGDAGDVAFEAKKRQSFTLRKPKPLTIQAVFKSLVKIANSKGTKSQDFKQGIVERLIQDARGAEESRYVVRTLVQHLRIGAVKTTMLIALSRAFLLSLPPNGDFSIKDRTELQKLKKEALVEIYSKSEETVKACFARRPNYNDLVPALLEVGPHEELTVRCGLALHVPLRPMLGSITRDLGEMLVKLQSRDFSCEFKYDGQRGQIHCDSAGKVSIFSRHLELMTEKYPDLVALVPKIRGDGVSSFIMEGEVVAIDHTTGEMKTFQTLAGRARKDVVIGSVEVGVCFFAFDLMYLNGESLLDRSFRERRELLRSLFIEVPHQFTWVKSIDATSNDSETVLEFFKSSLDIKCEGIMVKVLDNLPNPDLEPAAGDEEAKPEQPVTPKKKTASTKAADTPPKTRRKALLATYEPDKRLDSWLKVKKDYDSAAFDTLDLIPVGGWHGQGRKAAWWSPILLAARNPETGSLEAVCKCISGFTDKFYKANKEKYAEDGPNVIARPGYVEYVGEPDVWFEPQEVWEMAFADITLSPVYTAAIGLVSEERGLSMRFPRFLKVREDKGIDEASTNEFLASLYRKQESSALETGKKNDDIEEEEDGEER